MIRSTIPLNAYSGAIFQCVAPEKILDLLASGNFISQERILHCFLLCSTTTSWKSSCAFPLLNDEGQINVPVYPHHPPHPVLYPPFESLWADSLCAHTVCRRTYSQDMSTLLWKIYMLYLVTIIIIRTHHTNKTKTNKTKHHFKFQQG